MPTVSDFMDGETESSGVADSSGMSGEVPLDESGEMALESVDEGGLDLFAKSLNKNLSEYNNHPFVEGLDHIVDNKESVEGVKQMLRGIEGITDKDTQLALMDVLSGAIRVAKNLDLGAPEGGE